MDTTRKTSRPAPIEGIHHVTAMAGPAAANLAYYTRELGLRLVKKTVNFDDPGTYHLYYGDSEGRPGSLLTFFPWPLARRGQAGAGEVASTSLAVAPGSLEGWGTRLASAVGARGGIDERFERRVLELRDPDGMALELVEMPGLEGESIDGIASATLVVRDHGPTVELLTEAFGYRLGERRGRLQLLESVSGSRLVLEERPERPRPQLGAGSVHHIAFRVPDDATQDRYRELLLDRGLRVTPRQDRQYFHSVYFREPGRVLFELATDAPGFAIDEPVDELGQALKLPPWLEPARDRIEAVLPALGGEAAAGAA